MSAATRLLCLPGAGASAARFERLRLHVRDLVELRTFELPGRGIRFAEPSPTLLTDHVTHFTDRIEAEPYQRWIVLGESLGAVTATMVARALADSIRAEVIGVITVASAPKVTGRRPGREVIDLLKADAGALADDGADPIPMAVDAVLADIEAAHAIADRLKLRPVEVPLATIRGRDDGLIADEAARRWEERTTDRWWFREVPGNHYQFERPSPELIDAVRAAIGFVDPSAGRTLDVQGPADRAVGS